MEMLGQCFQIKFVTEPYWQSLEPWESTWVMVLFHHILLTLGTMFQPPKTPRVMILFFFFQLCSVTCEILVPPPGMVLVPAAVEAQGLNHWTTREFLLN